MTYSYGIGSIEGSMVNVAATHGSTIVIVCEKENVDSAPEGRSKLTVIVYTPAIEMLSVNVVCFIVVASYVIAKLSGATRAGVIEL